MTVHEIDFTNKVHNETLMHLRLVMSVLQLGPRLTKDLGHGMATLLASGTGLFFEIMGRLEEERTISTRSLAHLKNVVDTYRSTDSDRRNPSYTSLALGYCLCMMLVGRQDETDELLDEVSESWGAEMLGVMASGMSWRDIMAGKTAGDA